LDLVKKFTIRQINDKLATVDERAGSSLKSKLKAGKTVESENT
jgi:hypothetical protein